MSRAFVDEVAGVFAPDGPLADALEGFGWRAQQQAMAVRVAAVLQGVLDGEPGDEARPMHSAAACDTLICEAGTGTGKTFAYLAPAMLSGGKVIVATGTKNLQDQLFHRDIPALRRTLGGPIRVALLKGRANYLCQNRFDRALGRPDALPSDVQDGLAAIRDWGRVSHDGDIAGAGIAEDAPVWPVVTSTADNCLGTECPDWQRCHFVTARRRAQEAELLVINHHLLCADMVLREEGFGEVLPDADAVIVDEAHQLPEVATRFFGSSITSRQLRDLSRDLSAAYAEDAEDLPQLRQCADSLLELVGEVRSALGAEKNGRGAWRDLLCNQSAMARFADLRNLLADAQTALTSVSGRGKLVEHCQGRSATLLGRLEELLEDDDAARVRWYELRGSGFLLHRTPLDVATVFRGYRSRRRAAWVFTSATLAVGESFQHFADLVGAENAATALWRSPFDYRRQALLYLPKGLPDPASGAYDEAVASVARKVIEASRGRVFCLFTSHRALRTTARVLGAGLRYPLMIQGDAPRAELIERFRRAGDAVLLGTSSFWEGVDVRGDALSCVLIDRLPFAPPSDPLLQGRIDHLRRSGGRPFPELQLPRAVIALKQGAGRLIRDQHDRGVLVLCDPRLRTKGYGRVFLTSLPEMPLTEDLADVERFLQPPVDHPATAEGSARALGEIDAARP